MRHYIHMAHLETGISLDRATLEAQRASAAYREYVRKPDANDMHKKALRGAMRAARDKASAAWEAHKANLVVRMARHG